MKSKFEPDSANYEIGLNPLPPATWSNPAAYDATEEQLAASRERLLQESPKFVVEEQSSITPNTARQISHDALAESTSKLSSSVEESGLELTSCNEPPASTEPLPQIDSESWRQEVAARLNRFRAKRHPRTPRYPSLRLKFEASEATADPEKSGASGPTESWPATRQAITVESALPNLTAAPAQLNPPPARVPAADVPAPETTAKIIEFPRAASAPPLWLDELAEPVVNRPRILEAPEFAPPPPALGGILMEPVDVPANERRPGFEIPLQAAPWTRRVAAGTVDAVIVLLAFAGFCSIAFKVMKTVPPIPLAAETAVLVIALLWAGYQYLFLVHAGSTPGLKIAKLNLSLFDGSPVPQKVRRWRVLASLLSGASVGLGYAWCFLDEDQLCWHDRITKTYMAPTK